MEENNDPEKIVSLAEVRESFWLKQIQKNEKGGALPTVANALIIMANDPKLDGMLAYNSFTLQHMLMRAPIPPEDGGFVMPGPYPRLWRDEDISLLQAYMQRVWADRFSRNTVSDAVHVIAMARCFHPIADYLDSLIWDGKPRIDNWLANAFDADNSAYHRAIGAKFLIAAVRRVRYPGCKFDHMLILEGPQGIGKSSAARTLFGADFFSDAVPPDLGNRDAAIALHGLWCLEFAEIEHLVRAEIETIKAFISRAVDHYRPIHGKNFVDVPRQGVLIGTTNSDDYLRDATGNRRTWPVKCRTADIAWLEINKDQLWAEASAREGRGEAVWLDDADLSASAANEAGERMAEEVWQPAIEAWLRGSDRNRAMEVTSGMILENAIGMTKDKMTKAAAMRVGVVLKMLGWSRERIYVGSKRVRVWREIPEVGRLPDC